MTLPRAFLDRPLAHRGYHNAARGRVENSLSAFDAAIAQGYGIELDVQISADGHPVVFHDATLDRLTRASGLVAERSARDLAGIALGETGDCIATLKSVLDRVAGRAPVLIEIKDQTGGPGELLGIERATGDILRARPTGESRAVMSFNPRYILALRDLTDVPRGLTTGGADAYGDAVSDELRAQLVGIAHYEAAECGFVSHDHRDLDNPRLSDLKGKGASVLCWTIRSQAEADRALRVADNITFEDFAPA